MEQITFKNLSFTYPGSTRPALDGITLSIEEGEFVTLCGVSGCGKSTLLRQLKSVLTPHGQRAGEVLFGGLPLSALGARREAAEIGYVMQNPDSQIVTDKVWHELAFGLESLGLPQQAIRLRVAEMASYFGIAEWFHRDVFTLSGGQKQLLNLASVMAMNPSVLLLDEPTSQLDPIAAADFLQTVRRLNRELGVTVLLTEHRLEEALPLSDRAVVLDCGQVLADDSPRGIGVKLRALGHPMFRSMPAPMQLHALLNGDGPAPLTVREGRVFLEKLPLSADDTTVPDEPAEQPAALTFDEVWFRYERHSEDVLKGLSLSVPAGCCYAIVGANGAGKSTALALAMGLRHPVRGRVRTALRTGMLPQNPESLFARSSVREELAEMTGDRARIEQMISLCELSPLLEKHPYDLSGGEQQRTALAKVLLTEPQLLLLDEPTKGMDGAFKENFGALLRRLCADGVTVLLVSHDVEFCARYADCCAFFFDGQIVSSGAPASFFPGNHFYTTAANRMCRRLFPHATTVEEVCALCKKQL